MDLKPLIAEINLELNKTEGKINKPRLSAKVMTLVAELQDEETQLPADAFELLENDMRKAALLFLMTGVMQSLQD